MKVFGLSENIAVEMGNTVLVDLRPLFVPGDALEELGHFKSHMIPLITRTDEIDGVLLLSGMRRPDEPLQADDLLPLELLVARLTAVREHNVLMQRVARSEKLAGLGHLAAGVAHELNNPLTVVLGYSQILEETLEDDAEREKMTQVRGAAQRMRQILESMLRFWKSSPETHAQVSVTEILRDIGELKRADFQRRNVELLLNLPEDAPPVNGNRSQLQQVFLQLLNNALEALGALEAFGESANGQKRRVRVDVSHHADGVKILISDNGSGFADPERAFDPFFTTKSPRSGTGMGLSVSYAIVRDHGGEITAHNLEPHGAAIVVELPRMGQRLGASLTDAVFESKNELRSSA
jgi:signal transduction histidine kinase